MSFLSPFDEASYEEDVRPQRVDADWDLVVGGGADVAYALEPDHAWVSLSVEAGSVVKAGRLRLRPVPPT